MGESTVVALSTADEGDRAPEDGRAGQSPRSHSLGLVHSQVHARLPPGIFLKNNVFNQTCFDNKKTICVWLDVGGGWKRPGNESVPPASSQPVSQQPGVSRLKPLGTAPQVGMFQQSETSRGRTSHKWEFFSRLKPLGAPQVDFFQPYETSKVEFFSRLKPRNQSTVVRGRGSHLV